MQQVSPTTNIATVDALWRYPVKSMAGERLELAFMGFPGVYGDRIAAFTSDEQPEYFPWFTARSRHSMLTYKPRFRHPDRMAGPPHWDQIKQLGVGLTPGYGSADDMALDVVTPTGETLAINDPALARSLGGDQTLELVRSERALSDCRPVSLISLQTIRQLGDELNRELDPRRFRANLYLDLASDEGYGEDALIGRTIKVGSDVQIALVARDGRCQMITLDPDSGERDKEILKHVSQQHDNIAGVYGVVVSEGVVRPGDQVELV